MNSKFVCRFCNQELPEYAQNHQESSSHCKNHPVSITYFYFFKNKQLTIMTLYETNSTIFKAIQLDYSKNITQIFMHNSETPCLTIDGLVTNLTPDNFHDKLQTILTFS